jgi:ABC-2 type transport system ATP-binding protein
MNPRWDAVLAAERVKRLGLDPRQHAGKLSGGQRAQLALTLAVAKRPELLILDEPIASLDPLARREFLQDLADVITTRQVSVVMSSHLVGDLERRCGSTGRSASCLRRTGGSLRARPAWRTWSLPP